MKIYQNILIYSYNIYHGFFKLIYIYIYCVKFAAVRLSGKLNCKFSKLKRGAASSVHLDPF